MIWTTPRRFKTNNGLAVSKLGVGPVLILLHGVGLKADAWKPLAELLKIDFNVHAIDLPGHGDSQGLNLDTPRLTDYSDPIVTYIKTLETPVYLAGHSMGAMIALDIAIRFPDLIKSVVALNAIYQRSAEAAHAVQARAASLKDLSQADLNTDATLKRWFGDSPSGEGLEAAQFCKTWLHETSITQYQQAYEIFAHHDGATQNQLSQLNLPALFITGSEEPNSTPTMSHKMAELSPLGIAKIIPGAAHMMPMTHATDVATILTHHFKG